MKVVSESSLNLLKETYYKAGIERCLKELTSRQMIVLDKKTSKGEAMALHIDMGKPEVVHSLVNRIALKEDYDSYPNQGFLEFE